jgi:hypothetical protein
MRYEITYAEQWTQRCPTCGEWVVLHRPQDEPHKELSGKCENCDGDLVGFIYLGYGGVNHHVIDLNVDRS